MTTNDQKFLDLASPGTRYADDPRAQWAVGRVDKLPFPSGIDTVWFDSHDLAAIFIEELPDHETGCYFLDGPCYLKSGAEYVAEPEYCPRCGSDQIIGDSFESEGMTAWQRITCNACDLSYQDTYHLAGYLVEDDADGFDEYLVPTPRVLAMVHDGIAYVAAEAGVNTLVVDYDCDGVDPDQIMRDQEGVECVECSPVQWDGQIEALWKAIRGEQDTAPASEPEQCQESPECHARAWRNGYCMKHQDQQDEPPASEPDSDKSGEHDPLYCTDDGCFAPACRLDVTPESMVRCAHEETYTTPHTGATYCASCGMLVGEAVR